MGYFNYPVNKLSVIFVLVIYYIFDNLIKSILKDFVGLILVFDNRKNIAINLGLISFKKLIKTFHIAIAVAKNQFVVR